MLTRSWAIFSEAQFYSASLCPKPHGAKPCSPVAACPGGVQPPPVLQRLLGREMLVQVGVCCYLLGCTPAPRGGLFTHRAVPGGPAPATSMQWGDAGLRHWGKEPATWAVAKGPSVGWVALCRKGQKGQAGSFGAVRLHFAFFFADLS